MKKLILSLYFFFLCLFPIAQNVGIGTITPNSSAALDINSSDKGLLIPRIRLLYLNNALPVTNPQYGLLIFNTNDTVFENTEFNYHAQGYFYWAGNKWEKISSTNSGAVPKGSIIEFENKQNIREFTYIGSVISDSYYEKIGIGTGEWSFIPTISTNNQVEEPSTVWHNGKMFVWSGKGNFYVNYEKKGAWFDTASNAWFNMDTINSPVGRYGNVTVKDPVGGWMLVWGGIIGKINGGTTDVLTNTGGIYNLINNKWYSLSNGPLSARTGHTAIWDGNNMIVWGGKNSGATYNNDGAYYNLNTASWTMMPPSPLAPRYNHSAIWTGNKMVIWGGTDETTIFNDGAAYDPLTNTWSLIAAFNLFSPTFGHTAIWTGTDMIVFGGTNAYGITSLGYRYNVALNTWYDIAASPGYLATKAGVQKHRAIWTGTEMVILGGSNSYTFSTGVSLVRSYNPLKNSWKLYNDLPNPRVGLAAVWTGTQIIIQGGSFTDLYGYRFNPTGGTTTDIEVNFPKVFFKYRKD